MPRKVFFSFHFSNDFWRTQQIRNIGFIEGNSVATPNCWEEIKRKGDDNIKRWIDSNLTGKSCTIVLVGSETANRKWVKYEIEKSWELGKAVFGIMIHGLKDNSGNTALKGNNPFDHFNISGTSLSKIINCHDPVGYSSQDKYRTISTNMESWIEQAIKIRGGY